MPSCAPRSVDLSSCIVDMTGAAEFAHSRGLCFFFHLDGSGPASVGLSAFPMLGGYGDLRRRALIAVASRPPVVG